MSNPTAAQSGRVSRSGLYLSVTNKFLLSTLTATVWFLLSLWLAQGWIQDLSAEVGPTLAYPIIFLIALIPGFLNAHILTSVLLDAPPKLPPSLLAEGASLPPISILVAAYNEEANLPDTLASIAKQDYPGAVEVVVVDDGSTDLTIDILRSSALANLKIVHAKHGGKAAALTTGLERVTNELTVCIDADTFLHEEALKRIVARLIASPPDTVAVAGSVLVRNSRSSFMARAQEWDYFIGIASAKRQQGLYQGTLVAQGAFSIFRTEVLRGCGGWPSVIGEDIVLTWQLLSKGHRIVYEPTAVGFTKAPTNLDGFWRQRQRWARGMIEGLKKYGSLVWKGKLAGFFVGVDFLIPLIDLAYSLVFIPGIVLALTGRFYVVGPYTLLVLPLAFLIVLLMYQKQVKVFDELGLSVRRNSLGFLSFMLVYQALMSPICVAGYFKELAGVQKKW